MKNISKYDCGLKSTEVLFAIYADADEKNRYTSWQFRKVINN